MKKLFTIAALSLVSFVASATTPPSGWIVTDDSDPFTDAVNIYTYTQSTDGTGLFAVRCHGDRFSIAIVSDAYLNNGEFGKAMFRYDDKKAFTANVFYKDRTAFVHDWAVGLAQGVSEANTLAVGVFTYDDKRHVYKFDLAGSASAVSKVLKACGK